MDWQDPSDDKRVVLGVVKRPAMKRSLPPVFVNPGVSSSLHFRSFDTDEYLRAQAGQVSISSSGQGLRYTPLWARTRYILPFFLLPGRWLTDQGPDFVRPKGGRRFYPKGRMLGQRSEASNLGYAADARSGRAAWSRVRPLRTQRGIFLHM